MSYRKTIDEVFKIYETKPNGLSEIEIENRKKKYGTNLLIKKKNKSLFIVFLKNLLEPMMLLLSIALGFTIFISLVDYYKYGIKDFRESYGILASILLSSIINIWMEGKSRKAFDSLSKLQNCGQVIVVRDGKEKIINSDDVVVGDIVVLKTGNKIYADGRVFLSNLLEVDESSLTGESIPQYKDNFPIYNQVPLAERKNMVYSSSYVVGGSGQMVVTNVGYKTELGKIANNLKEEVTLKTPLEQQLNSLSKYLVIIGVVVAIAMFFLSLFQAIKNNNFSKELLNDIFITSTIYIVSAVPEGLPGIVAISLAINVVKMSKQNALVKKMISVETIGCVDIICTDKTGTLTENKMKVSDVYDEKLKIVTNPTGDLLTNMLYNHSVTEVVNGSDVSYNGNPTECAILNKLNTRLTKKVDIITPFSSQNKYMIVSVEEKEYLKGAIEKVLEKCEINIYFKDKILKEVAVRELKAERIIAFASKNKNDKKYKFDGFVSLIDPIKEEVYKAIETATKANIRVIVITGDGKNTATAILNKLKLLKKDSLIISGEEIDNMNENKLVNISDKLLCIYRATPNTKLKIINLYKNNNHIVAMTGDGINDALALKEADVGISMGINGTEVAKNASDIVLLDDSFSTIIKAIGFGRNIYENFKRFIIFQVTVNISFIILIISTMLLGYQSPFTALELLWINIIMDGPPALALGTSEEKNQNLEAKKFKRNEKILTTKMVYRIITTSLVIAFLCILQTRYNYLGGTDLEQKSIIFSMFVFMQLGNIFNITKHKNIFKQKILLLVIALMFVLQIIIVNYGVNLFELHPLSITIWVKIFIVMLVSNLVINTLNKR